MSHPSIAPVDQASNFETFQKYSLGGRPEQGLELAARLRVLEAQLDRIDHYRANGKAEQVRTLLACYARSRNELLAFLDMALPFQGNALRLEILACLPTSDQLVGGMSILQHGCGNMARLIERVCHATILHLYP